MEAVAELEAYLERLLGTLEDLSRRNPVGGEAVSLPACRAEGQRLLSEASVTLRLSQDQTKVLRRRVLNLSADLSDLRKALGEKEGASSRLRARAAALGRENSRLRSRLEKPGAKAGVDAGDCDPAGRRGRGSRAPEPSADLGTSELGQQLQACREDNRQLRARLGARDEALQVLVKELTRIESTLA